MVMIDVGDPKMAREALCRIQGDVILTLSLDLSVSTDADLNRIDKMIDQIDVLRPLGPDGKHGNRHTDNCGCDGVIDWRQIAAHPFYSVDSTGRLRNHNGYLIALRYGPPDKATYYNLQDSNRYRLTYTPEQLVKECFPELEGPTEWPLMKVSD